MVAESHAGLILWWLLGECAGMLLIRCMLLTPYTGPLNSPLAEPTIKDVMVEALKRLNITGMKDGKLVSPPKIRTDLPLLSLTKSLP